MTFPAGDWEEVQRSAIDAWRPTAIHAVSFPITSWSFTSPSQTGRAPVPRPAGLGPTTMTLDCSHRSRQSDWRGFAPGGSGSRSRFRWGAWPVRGFFSACPQQHPRHTVAVQPAAPAAVRTDQVLAGGSLCPARAEGLAPGGGAQQPQAVEADDDGGTLVSGHA